MSVKNHLKMLLGIMVTVAIVVAGFLYLNYTMSRVVSQEAQLESDNYAVSIDYPGLVTKAYVQEGDRVKKGDTLFQINSSELRNALTNDKIDKSSLLFDLTDSNDILVKANQDGTIRQIKYRDGVYVPPNGILGTIAVDDSTYVIAKYQLKASDYDRIDRDNPVEVTLPDNTKLDGKVFDISLQRDGQQVKTIAKARLDSRGVNDAVFTPGTPVTTTWRLKNNQWYDFIVRIIERLFVPTSETR